MVFFVIVCVPGVRCVEFRAFTGETKKNVPLTQVKIVKEICWNFTFSSEDSEGSDTTNEKKKEESKRLPFLLGEPAGSK